MVVDFTSMEHGCRPYSPFFVWLNDWLNICVEDPHIAVSNVFGYLSIFSWLTAQVPQLYTNYLNQSAASLSLRFLANWLMGDITNFIGSMLTRQLPFQIFLALYFCLIDMTLLCQYFYYRRRDRRRRRHFSSTARISRRASHSAVTTFDRHRHHRRHYCLTGSVDSHGAWFAPSTEVERVMRLSTENHLHHTYTTGLLMHHQDGNNDNNMDNSGEEECIESVSSVRSYRLNPICNEDEDSSSDDAASTESTHLLADASLVPYYTTSRRNSMAIRQSASTLFSLSFLALYYFIDPSASNFNDAMNYGHGIAFDSTLIGHSLTRRAFVAGAIEPDSVMERWFTRDRIGIIVAWACAALYLTSRMPQIYKNYTRQSAEGLSVFMFMFAAMGNFTYVTSILARSTSMENIQHALPFLVGSGGTLIFDLTIFTQFYHYSRKKETEASYSFLPTDTPSINVHIPSNGRRNGVRNEHENDDDDRADVEVDTVRGMIL